MSVERWVFFLALTSHCTASGSGNQLAVAPQLSDSSNFQFQSQSTRQRPEQSVALALTVATTVTVPAREVELNYSFDSNFCLQNQMQACLNFDLNSISDV